MSTHKHRTFRHFAIIALLVSLCVYGGSIASVWAQGARPDPGQKGNLVVTSKQYTGNNIEIPGFPTPVELRAAVWYPQTLDRPLPIVFFLHGRHTVCFQGARQLNLGTHGYPCPQGFTEVPSHLGYEYLAKSLASHGHIVVSISANGINIADESRTVPDGGGEARARLIQYHLSPWRLYNVGVGPMGRIFQGKVDLSNVGVMGHSRGGEGVVRHANLTNGPVGFYNIKAALLLAPSNYNRWTVNRIPLGVMLPYCDGDVSDLQGIHYYDDARYNVIDDAAPKHSFLMLGANHNFFNTKWSPADTTVPGEDDWYAFNGNRPGIDKDDHCSSFGRGQRLTEGEQRAAGLAYIQAFFLNYLSGQSQFSPYLTGDATVPASAQPSKVYASYHAPALQRRTLQSMSEATPLQTNTLGDRVVPQNVTTDLCGGPSPRPQHCLGSFSPNFEPYQPHTAPSRFSSKRGLSQLRVDWRSPNAGFINGSHKAVVTFARSIICSSALESTLSMILIRHVRRISAWL